MHTRAGVCDRGEGRAVHTLMASRYFMEAGSRRKQDEAGMEGERASLPPCTAREPAPLRTHTPTHLAPIYLFRSSGPLTEMKLGGGGGGHRREGSRGL